MIKRVSTAFQGLFLCFLVLFLALPFVSFAQPDFTGDLVQCDFCGFCDLIVLAENIVNFLVFFAVVVAILMIVYSGFLFLTSGESETGRSKAKRTLWATLLGLIITLAAWIIINVIMTTFLGGNILNALGGSWGNLPGC